MAVKYISAWFLSVPSVGFIPPFPNAASVTCQMFNILATKRELLLMAIRALLHLIQARDQPAYENATSAAGRVAVGRLVLLG
jgi:hypothetical protein